MSESLAKQKLASTDAIQTFFTSARCLVDFLGILPMIADY
jgi:hypothetical protein